ncbi:MAG: dipeptidase [Clostridiales bacterium]|jgi:microsomal dipeptidase-like Zn-dependent dipeptidase|nr:dipeptidase [Clostridiales bacterium]
MIFDAHNDLLTAGLSDRQTVDILNGLDGLESLGGVTLAVWTTDGGCTADGIAGRTCLAKALNPRVKLVFAVEDLGFADDNDIEKLCAADYKYYTPTWNFSNKIGGGAYGDGGLTDFGRRAVGKLARRALIDCAHMNGETFFDTADITGRIINSHTGFSGIKEHPRNITDEQIKIIIACGGIVGLAFVGDFLCEGRADVNAVIRNIDYFTQRFGADCLCIGTDFGGTADLPAGISGYRDFDVISYGLDKLGYGGESIRAIFGGNYLAKINAV